MLLNIGNFLGSKGSDESTIMMLYMLHFMYHPKFWSSFIHFVYWGRVSQSLFYLFYYRKVGTAVISSMTAFHTVFNVDYGDDEHVFTDIQRWYRQTIDNIIVGEVAGESEGGVKPEQRQPSNLQDGNIISKDLKNQITNMNSTNNSNINSNDANR